MSVPALRGSGPGGQSSKIDAATTTARPPPVDRLISRIPPGWVASARLGRHDTGPIGPDLRLLSRSRSTEPLNSCASGKSPKGDSKISMWL